MPQGVPQGMPQGMQGMMPQGMPQGMQGMVPQGMQGMMPQGMPQQGMPQYVVAGAQQFEQAYQNPQAYIQQLPNQQGFRQVVQGAGIPGMMPVQQGGQGAPMQGVPMQFQQGFAQIPGMQAAPGQYAQQMGGYMGGQMDPSKAQQYIQKLPGHYQM
ncbi:hypothetical protein GUITHDRAFT_150308 [Guillardia theta CCMP2712]|uniref:Uncharacterized protein n=2 Tax=Guillardia theta TaxID=55529 RepID=L1JZ52_GUITC|nr:hypothetical protein GUITHDRAFT_150308 [Guillardia theta CCMP2712]EKX53836.1 hypothetical protein GUITHDRAFT_150308 [Guillardia theta CCMP2712]|eukprot:XP_005840816.1 hypothetical protein GUITHDRAFT_150308 [Guillardia theta CCMP2712]